MLCSRLQPSAPWRMRLRRLSCMRARKASAWVGSIWYSMVTTTRPASGMLTSGRWKALEGLKSSSIWRSRTRRWTSSMQTTPLAAATMRLPRTPTMLATCPQSAAPVAVPPMMDIW